MNGNDTSFPPLSGQSPAEDAEVADTRGKTSELVALCVTALGASRLTDIPRFIDRLPSAQRKQFPMCTGNLDYFPDAHAAVSHISWLGNEKHNSGEPLHHARGKSMDHPDCIVRHQSTRHDVDPAYKNDVLAPVFHLAEAAWRSLAQLQQAMEEHYNLALAPGAREE